MYEKNLGASIGAKHLHIFLFSMTTL